MTRSELRRQEGMRMAAVYAYRHATVLLGFSQGNEEAEEAIHLALEMLERAWQALDKGPHPTLLELSEKAVV
jgi:hypothetical protein